MEENSSAIFLDGEIVGLKFCLATPKEILTSSVSGFPINHVSQLSNSYLGLPLEFGKCNACGTSEPGKCEGHFGYIELPIPIYHPSHISELKRLLSLLCLKCLKLKNKFQMKSGSVAERLLTSCCQDTPQVSIKEVKTTDGACYLELKQPSRHAKTNWSFLERYGFRYGDRPTRTLLAREVMEMLKKIPAETRRKLSGKGFFSQEGYILQYLPVPPNCLSVPDISDGVSVMSSDLSTSMLKKVLKQVEIIKGSRSGTPNFESHEVEANDLQSAVEQYLQVRGTVKASRNIDARFGISKDSGTSSTKAWLEKMRTLFIRKGSGFSSRSVITGDPYTKVNEIGIPSEIAQRITFEERVNMHNVKFLQNLVDNKSCLTYKDGSSTYSLREGSKGHTFLRPGQVAHRRIMDGDIVFINRPPTTHKHSLQALSVYVHDDHTVKINPLICGPLSADFDGDCIHLFYPQSLAARAEVFELFSVEKQLLSSHSGHLNLQLASDSLLSLRVMLRSLLFKKADAQQLSMFLSSPLPQPAFVKGNRVAPCWTAFQILQTAFPACLDCSSDRYLIEKSDILKVDFNKDLVQSVINEVVASIFFEKGPKEVLNFFDSVQPLLMENIFAEGFTVSLEDFSVSREVIEDIEKDLQVISPLLYQLRSTYNELIVLQMENQIRVAKAPVADFIVKSSAMGNLIDSKSDSAVNKVVQQIGFLGLQLSDKGKFYTKTLVEDVAYRFQSLYPSDGTDYRSAEFGLVKSCFFHGLDPYEGMVHSISTREVMVRSSRGLTEPGTLFKNLMAILRDVVICYDGTVRNISSNSIIQFQYGLSARTRPQFPAGEPVGVLAATAMSNPAYKAVLDSSPSSNNSWELMKEILLCKVSFRNDLIDRRVILYLKDCDCGKKYCQENAAYMVKNQLRKVKLKDMAVEFIIEYKQQETESGLEGGLVGRIFLNKALLKELNISIEEVRVKCQETIISFRKKKKISETFRRTDVLESDFCSSSQSCADKWLDMPCLEFVFRHTNDDQLDSATQILAEIIYPVLLETVVKGDPRICSTNIIWVNSDTTTWIRKPNKTQKGELALDVVLEKSAVKQSGDAWRTVMDCCLPVLNLIDVQRSIPYAIKQVEDLLGISCAFEQVVQRLSSSVSMVAKGVLKEHLMLLANSMTCAGILIGFNPGGYKALTRSLKIQVPFTEATLFTPRKCFEKAAEKCFQDSLSSIVASCSWGKRVAVGTGSRFDILWDQKEVENDMNGMDVYNFLHMVGGAGGTNYNTACLGEEVDDLMEVDDMADWSPEHTGLDKPVFEDAADFENSLDCQPAETGWGNSMSSDKGSGGGWDAATGSKKQTEWSGWATNKNTEDGDGFAAAATGSKKQTEWSGWATNKNTEDGDGFAAAATGSKKQTEWSGWATNKNTEDGDGFAAAATGSKKQTEWSGWATNQNTEDGDGFAAAATGSKKQTEWSGWATNKNTEDVDGFAAAATGSKKQTEWSGWATNKNTEDGDGFAAAATSSKKQTEWSGWASNKNTEDGDGFAAAATSSKKKTEWSSWATNKNTEDGDGFAAAATGSKKQTEWSGWRNKNHEPLDAHIDGESLKSNARATNYNSESQNAHIEGESLKSKARATNNNSESQDVFSSKVDGMKEQAELSCWPNKNHEPQDAHIEGESLKSNGWDAGASWGTAGRESKKPDASNALPWSDWATKEAGPTKTSGQYPKSSWMEEKTSKSNGGDAGASWGTTSKESEKHDASDAQPWSNWVKKDAIPTKADQATSGWGSLTAEGWTPQNESNQPASSSGWDTPHGEDTETEKHQWLGRRWVSDAGKKNLPPRPPRAAMYTVTRQRLDMFTSEEQDILSDVEPLMQSIRKIMHQPGYNDGDPLPDDDQSFILDNVFTHHPDKAAKTGAGIDYIMVNNHSVHTESRCMYIVTTDGHKQDFSYIKCLGSFIKGKYPNLADEFVEKYFKRRSREQSVAPESTEVVNTEESPAAENTEVVNTEESPAADNTEVVNTEESPAAENTEGGNMQEDSFS